jgi:serine/threonine protein kinase
MAAPLEMTGYNEAAAATNIPSPTAHNVVNPGLSMATGTPPPAEEDIHVLLTFATEAAAAAVRSQDRGLSNANPHRGVSYPTPHSHHVWLTRPRHRMSLSAITSSNPQTLSLHRHLTTGAEAGRASPTIVRPIYLAPPVASGAAAAGTRGPNSCSKGGEAAAVANQRRNAVKKAINHYIRRQEQLARSQHTHCSHDIPSLFRPSQIVEVKLWHEWRVEETGEWREEETGEVLDVVLTAGHWRGGQGEVWRGELTGVPGRPTDWDVLGEASSKQLYAPQIVCRAGDVAAGCNEGDVQALLSQCGTAAEAPAKAVPPFSPDQQHTLPQHSVAAAPLSSAAAPPGALLSLPTINLKARPSKDCILAVVGRLPMALKIELTTEQAREMQEKSSQEQEERQNTDSRATGLRSGEGSGGSLRLSKRRGDGRQPHDRPGGFSEESSDHEYSDCDGVSDDSSGEGISHGSGSDCGPPVVWSAAFRNELEVLSQLQGLPQVVQGFGAGNVAVGEKLVLPCILLEWVLGSLWDFLASEEERTGQKGLRGHLLQEVVLQVTIGVAAVNGSSVAHMDLKPGNIMLGRAAGGGLLGKLCDFAMASTSRNSHAKVLRGTAGYMAPEHLESRVCGPKCGPLDQGASRMLRGLGKTPQLRGWLLLM